MKHFHVFFLIVNFVSCTLFSQEREPSKSIFLELGGAGGLGSINYEKEFSQKEKITYSWRLGISFAPIDKNNGTGIVVPAMIHGTIGQQKHLLDLGIGQGLTVTTRGRFFILTTASVGYRYQFERSPLFMRIAYTPLISYLLDVQLQHWGGLSIGYTFKNSSK